MKTHTIDKGIEFERAVVEWIAEQIDRPGSKTNHSQIATLVFGGSSPAANWRKIKIGHEWKSGKAGRLNLEAAYRFIVALGEDPGKVFLMIAENVRQNQQS
jgi:hypothetical protein